MQAEKLLAIKIKEGLAGHAYLLVGDQKTLADQVQVIRRSLEIKDIEVLKIQPEDKKNGEISISQIRQLKRDLSIKATGRRLVIIDQADKLNLEAGNSFLKTLEEPPKDTVLILLSQTGDLLSTILSRCQLYQFSKLVTNYQQLSEKEIIELKGLSLKRRFELAEKIAKSSLADKYLDDLTLYYHQLFLKGEFNNFFILGKIEEAKSHLQANVSPRLALENVFLNLC